MSAPTGGAIVRATVLAVLLAALSGGLGFAGPAGAQTDTSGVTAAATAAPMLTVTDATIERCGPVAVTGTNFEPDARVSIQVNGTTEDESPTVGPTGTFTFTTDVACEQTSGFLKIQASDGRITVPIDVAIAAAPEPLAPGRGSTDADSSSLDAVAIWSVRVVLLGVLVAELVFLWKRQRDRRSRRARQQEAVAP